MSNKVTDHTLIVTEINHREGTSSIMDAVSYDTAAQRDVAMQLLPEAQADPSVDYELSSFDEEFTLLTTKLVSRSDAEHLFGRSIAAMRDDAIVINDNEHFLVGLSA